MGIGAYTKFFWGVNLSWDETRKLRQAVATAFTNSGVAFEEYNGSPTLDKIACLVAHAFPTLKHLDFLTMIADGADSGADTIHFTEGYTHGVGMTVAEKVAGYPPSTALTPHAPAIAGVRHRDPAPDAGRWHHATPGSPFRGVHRVNP